MGRYLLLATAAVSLFATLAMGSLHRSAGEQDRRISSFESDVIARENAASALRLALPFVEDRFDSLVAGQTVSTRSLIGAAGVPAPGAGVYAAAHRLVAATNALRLAAGGAAQTLLPTREVASGSLMQATVRALDGGRVEVVAEGVAYLPQPGGGYTPHSVSMRRVLARASALDAALVVVAPSVNAQLTGNYRIDGRDTDPQTLAVTGKTEYDRHGIKTNAALVAQGLGAAVGAAQRDRVMGVGGAGDIVAGTPEADLNALFDEAFTRPGATVVSSTALGSTTFGSASAPAVVVRRGNLALQGTVRGTGILVVDGDLTTTGPGKLVWDGIVMARRDGSANLTATLGNGSQITGSYVLLQGAAALVMPFNARVKVRYLSSNAGIASSVGIEHAAAGTLTRHTLVAAGANRGGNTPVVQYLQDLQAGEQVNFFIGATQGGVERYRHYARGNFAPRSGKPYGIANASGDYGWTMAFEDIDEQTNIGYGTSPDWDYDRAGQEDQKIEVTLQCRSYRSGALYTVAGVQQYEDCTPDNPDTRQQDVALNWSGLTANAGQVATPMGGTQLTFGLQNATLVHSSRSIGRLVPLLRTLRESSRIVVVEAWASR